MTTTHRKTLSVLAAVALSAAAVTAMVQPVMAEPAAATHQTLQHQTFTIDNMTCAMCPITVRKAMQKVDGVQSVKVDFDSKTASVTFDPAKASAADIAAASTRAGYPAHPSSN